MQLVVNGKSGAWWRIDYMDIPHKDGADFLLHPFAVVPDYDNASLIVAC